MLFFISFDYFIKFAYIKLIEKCLNNQVPSVLSDMVAPGELNRRPIGIILNSVKDFKLTKVIIVINLVLVLWHFSCIVFFMYLLVDFC